MILEKEVIEFKGMPLFEKAKVQSPFEVQAEFKEFACFFYIIHGDYQTIESGGVCRIGKKEALIKKCGNFLAKFFSSGQETPCEAIAVYLYPDVLRAVYKHQIPQFFKETIRPSRPAKIVSNELLEQYIKNLMMYFENPEIMDEDLAVLKIKELIMVLLKTEQYEDVQSFFKQVFCAETYEFTAIVENNLLSPISIEELAFICHKSLSSFKREFKRVFNDTPARYIKKRRLEHAAELLLTMDESISRIAFQSGFRDPTTFSSTFQEYYGQSPSQYRLTKSRKRLS